MLTAKIPGSGRASGTKLEAVAREVAGSAGSGRIPAVAESAGVVLALGLRTAYGTAQCGGAPGS